MLDGFLLQDSVFHCSEKEGFVKVSVKTGDKKSC